MATRYSVPGEQVIELNKAQAFTILATPAVFRDYRISCLRCNSRLRGLDEPPARRQCRCRSPRYAVTLAPWQDVQTLQAMLIEAGKPLARELREWAREGDTERRQRKW